MVREMVRVVHEARSVASGNYSVKRSIIPIDYLEVDIQGTKAIDSAVISTKSKYISNGDQNYAINRGDVISIITDDVATENLVGAYNFYRTLRDESGYNIDGVAVNSTTEAYGVETSVGSRFQGQKYLDCESQPKSIKLMQSTEEGNNETINFNGGCEIQMWFKTPASMSGSKQIIYQRMDSNRGIEVGIEKSGSNYYMYWSTRIQKTGSSTKYNETTIGQGTRENMEVELGKEYFFRLWREDDYVQNNAYKKAVFKGTVNADTTDNGFHTTSFTSDGEYWLDHTDGTNIPTYIGSDSSGTTSTSFRGRLFALRVYSHRLESARGSFPYSYGLTTLLHKRLMPSLTMKFSGTVDKIEEKFGGRAIINCIGWSSILDAELGDNIVGSSEITDQLLETTIQNIFNGINTTSNKIIDNTGYVAGSKLGKDVQFKFNFSNPNDEDDYGEAETFQDIDDDAHKYSPRHIAKLMPTNKVIDLIRILAILGGREIDSSGNYWHDNGADQFFMHPRKVLIFESGEIDNHAYCSPTQGFRLDKRGSNMQGLYNDVFVFGDVKVKEALAQINTPNAQSYALTTYYSGLSKTNRKAIVGIEVFRSNNGNTLTFQERVTPSTYTWDGKNLTFNSSSSRDHQIILKYIDLTNYGSVDGNTSGSDKDYTYPNFYTALDETSINKWGHRSFKIHLPMMEDITSTASLCRRIIGERSRPSNSLHIMSSRLEDSMWLGMKITCTEEAKDIHGLDVAVKSISWRYEKGKGAETEIIAGDHDYDFLDQLNTTMEKIGQTTMSDKNGRRPS
tara:strand:- start:47 stop:2419 length:2373 start_codon:yes stop_codon:yes gene_type:complete